MKALYDSVSFASSRLLTHRYSTSFSIGIKSLAKRFHDPIYGIYGFVRIADEIVDTFHDYDKKNLLDRFEKETYQAIEEGISTNPILNSFQHVVNHYEIPHDLIDAFLASMRFDLDQIEYSKQGYEQYIYGSAEVVGLMCLKVFVEGDQKEYDTLVPYAKRLGAAFQKINFLRDLKADFKDLGRTYFPNIDFDSFSASDKRAIEKEILEDFQWGFEGIKRLPVGAKFGVYVAYSYYFQLFKKISRTPASLVMSRRIRIPNFQKGRILLGSYLKHRLNMIWGGFYRLFFCWVFLVI